MTAAVLVAVFASAKRLTIGWLSAGRLLVRYVKRSKPEAVRRKAMGR